jgi:hypothetical protein
MDTTLVFNSRNGKTYTYRYLTDEGDITATQDDPETGKSMTVVVAKNCGQSVWKKSSRKLTGAARKKGA